MYEKYLIQIEEAGKIRNLKERSINCYKNYVSYYTIYFATDETLTISPGKYFEVEDTYYEFDNYDELWDEFIVFNSIK